MEDETQGTQEAVLDYKPDMTAVEGQLNNLIEQHKIYFDCTEINTDDLRRSIESGNIEGLCAALSLLHKEIRKHDDDLALEVDTQVTAIILLLNPDYTEPEDSDEKKHIQKKNTYLNRKKITGLSADLRDTCLIYAL